MKHSSLRFVSLAGLIFSSLLQADTPAKRFHYAIRLPESTRSCADAAAQTARTFSSITGLTVSEPSCRAIVELSEGEKKFKLYSIGFTYWAQEAAPSYTAYLGSESLGVPGKSLGVYTEYATCLADLAKQTHLYETSTGYSALAATCQEGDLPYFRSYVLRIDGFSPDARTGVPQANLFGFTPRFRYRDDLLNQQVEALLKKLGGQIAHRSKTSIYYYSAAQLPVSYEYLGVFQDGAECDAQLADVQAIFAKLGSKNVIARCLRAADPTYVKDATLEIVRDVAPKLSHYQLKTSSYYSYAECLADRERALDEATSNAAQGQRPVGALCRKQSTTRYDMLMFLGL